MTCITGNSAELRPAPFKEDLYHLCLATKDEDVKGMKDVANELGQFGVQVLHFGGLVRRFESAQDPMTEDVIINLTRPIDLPLIEHLLRPAGRRVLHLRPVVRS